MSQRIKAGDEVVVISGKDKGKRGRVLRLLKDKDRVVVEGINIVTRHLKRDPRNPREGGRQERPAPIHISKVMPWSDDDAKGVRVRYEGEGTEKHRVSASSGKTLTSAGRAKEKKSSKKEG